MNETFNSSWLFCTIINIHNLLKTLAARYFTIEMNQSWRSIYYRSLYTTCETCNKIHIISPTFVQCSLVNKWRRSMCVYQLCSEIVVISPYFKQPNAIGPLTCCFILTEQIIQTRMINSLKIKNPTPKQQVLCSY